MTTRTSALTAGVLAMITLGGCTSTNDPAPDGSVPSPRGSGDPGLPPRAREVSVRGVDPCSLLTTEQLNRLKENGIPRLLPEDTRRDGPTCAFDVDATTPSYTYYLEVIATADLRDWTEGGHFKASATREPVNVPGFPALIHYAPSRGVPDCETLVGVAEGQTLRAETAPDGNTFTRQQLCDMSTTVAKMAVETLETFR
ncbi:DUF3558 domain-containing protein [Amycolatopsis rhizosphaerae]|nr:DUF3558 domain-containing protein [Amycolatopsis rhizosphaerae]